MMQKKILNIIKEKKIRRPQPYKYGGHNVPGMFKGILPKAQWGWFNKYKDDVKDFGSKVIDSSPLVSKKNKKKTKKTIKNVANRINSFFGGDSNYWKKGGGLR